MDTSRRSEKVELCAKAMTVLSAAGPVQVRDMCDEALTGELRAGGQVYLIAWKPMLIHQHQNDAR
jgi:hypothetical protein